MINTKVRNEVIFVMFIHISLELLVCCSLGFKASWETRTVASWDRLLLGELSSSSLEVVLCGNDIMVNTEVWNEVVLIVFVHVSLELLVSSSLGFKASWETRTITSWDRLLLGELSSSSLEVVLCGDDIMVNTEVWNEVVLIVFVHV